MHLSHALIHHLRTLARQYPLIARPPLTVLALVLLWFYAIYVGERSVSTSHITACDWSTWEHWPEDATPHHLVFIADPQIVDPHTYPGRPWPLNVLTERYTDRYMRRNFRLINAKLDPDSVVFLGDLMDGGREWATSRARPLKASQKKYLKDIGVMKDDEPKKEEGAKAKRSMQSYKKAIMSPHTFMIRKEDHMIDKRGNDLKEFVHGENGRWSQYGPAQWDKEFDRFGSIFFAPEQLYPTPGRKAYAAWDVPTHPISVENGAASDTTWQEYAISGGKTRRLITSLPGNHDLGFGPGVQLAVKDRFETHFGETSRVDVIGNHTFVSIDAPSLAAYNQFEVGGETSQEVAAERKHIWQPAIEFIGNVQTPVVKAVAAHLDDLYPDSEPVASSFQHAVEESATKSDTRSASTNQQALLPVILLSHVPLYRDPDTDCGKLRERGHSIKIGGGYQYQNTLTKGMSQQVSQKVSAAGEIVHIFSGDDHDYCDVSHRWNLNVPKFGKAEGITRLRNIREITVKSFSWAMGVRRPGFQLVSLWNPVDSSGSTIGTPLPTVQSHLCLLPDQLGIFIAYAQLAALTLVILLIYSLITGFPPPPPPADSDPDSDSEKLLLPCFRANGQANGFSTPSKPATKTSRQRASSTSHNLTPSSAASNQHLGVQRSYTARTRSVSPASPYTPTGTPNSGGLIEKAGYYPQVRWVDPGDTSEDEESNVGSSYGGENEEDSQAKWKRRRRMPGRGRRVWGKFWRGLGVVGGVAGGFYVVMVRTA